MSQTRPIKVKPLQKAEVRTAGGETSNTTLQGGFGREARDIRFVLV